MRLTCGRAWLKLDPVGAIVADAALFSGALEVRPFFQNPWRNDPRKMDTLTRHLGGEWPCVPFGVPQPLAALPGDWQNTGYGAEWHKHAHGYGAHSAWTFARQDAHTVLAEILYPTSSPIVGLRRSVCLASENEIILTLEVETREDTKLPIGVHPVFTLADAASGSAKLRIAGDDTAWTFPADVEPGRSCLKPDQRSARLSSLATSDGSVIDASHVPFPCESEDLVLLTAPGGCVSLSRPDRGYRVDVRWNANDLPSCLLWLSNRGRRYPPWDGRVCAIGIEPVASAFDLGVAQSTSATTPLARKEIQTCVELREGQEWRTSYSIGVHPELD